MTPPITLGPFRILERLGEGGMGVVYRAVQISLERVVALKVLRAFSRSDAEMEMRFEREMRVAAALSHPNLVKVFDGGTVEGTSYIAMELLEGSTLAEVLKGKGRMPWREALRIGEKVASGLACLHGHGLLHRDIKPQNVFLTVSGDVKLLDFGLVLVPSQTRLTEAGSVVGTLEYMAPELLVGQPASAAADLWSAGCVLHELLTGRRPLEGTDVKQYLSAIANLEVIPPSASIPELPEAVDDLILSLLAVEAPQRLADAAELAKRAGALAEGESGRRALAARVASVRVAAVPGRTLPSPPRASQPGSRRTRLRWGWPLVVLGVILAGLLAGLPHRREVVPGRQKALGPSPVAVPSPPASAARGALSTSWREIENMLPRLEADPLQAKGIAALVRRRSRLDLGPSPEVWIWWIRMGRWLEDAAPRMAPPRAPAAKAAPLDGLVGAPVAPLLSFMKDVDPHPPRAATPGATTLAAALLLNMEYPDDAATWLALGRVLECERGPAAAGAAYARGLELMPASSLSGAPHAVWTALARALMSVPGRRLESEWLPWVKTIGGEANAWSGLTEALPGAGEWPRLRALLEAGAREPAMPAAYPELGTQLWARELDYRKAAEVWAAGARAHPDFAGLWLIMANGELHHGRIALADAALAHVDRAHPLRVAAALSAAPRAAGRTGAVADELVDLHVAARLEVDDLAGAEAVAAAAGPAFLVSSPRAAFELAAAGSRDARVHEVCASTLARGINAGTLFELLGVLDTPAASGWRDRVIAAARPPGCDEPRRELARALDHSRRSRHEDALDALERALTAAPGLESNWEAILEVQGRPIWYAAAGARVDPAAVRRARARPAPRGPARLRIEDYWAGLVRDRRAETLAAMRRAFEDNPYTPVMILAHASAGCAALEGAPRQAIIEQCRAAARFNRAGLWVVRELDRLAGVR